MTNVISRTPRVLHVYRTYFPDTQGGGEEMIRQVCRNTTLLGVENRVFTLTRDRQSPIIERPEADIFRGMCHGEFASCNISFSAFRIFRDLVRWADIIHYYFPWPYADFLHLVTPEARAKPSLASHLSDIVRQQRLMTLYRPLMKNFLASMHRLVATSPNYLDSSDLLASYRDKVSVIPIGLRESDKPLADRNDVARLRTRYGSSFLLFVGVLRYYKGLHVLLEAAKKIPVPIVIAGTGPMESELKALARQYKLDHVHFLGKVSDPEKAALLTACRALVFPSHLPSESFGVSLVEAAMHSKPMITCEIGTGTTYVNKHRQTGLVVSPGSSAQLAEAMAQLVSDEGYAEQLGSGARKRYEDLFTGERMGQLYVELYTELMQQRAPG